jgi:uncharacterized protein YprB with RNaseH-like and TPR domain
MDLKRRLDTLRRQSGFEPKSLEPSTPVPHADLRRRLDRLGARAAGAPLPGSPTPDRDPGGRLHDRVRSPGLVRGTPMSATDLAQRWGGEVVDRCLIRVERRYPLTTRHGNRYLSDALGTLEPFANAVSTVSGVGRPPEGRVIGIDTETTGLSGGTGTTVFMIGIAEVEVGHVRLRQWLLTAFAGESALLAELEAALFGVGLMVSYNGRSFDWPLLRTRRRLQRDADLPELPHLDLLHPTRRLFRERWPDCRLATAEQHLLGLSREDDLPGSEAPRVWREYLAGGPVDDLQRVLHHNALDVISLLLLGPALARVLREPVAHGANPVAAAEIWQQQGQRERALRLLERARGQLDERGALMLARELRRAGRWQEAAGVWTSLAAAGCSEALENLAKYHEHRRRDWQRALECTRLLDEDPDVHRRRLRLERRLETAQQRLDFGPSAQDV